MNTLTQATSELIPVVAQSPLPAGSYHVKLLQAVRTGPLLTSQFRVVRGPFEGRVIYLVTRFDDQKSRELFQSWCRSIGKLCPQETSELAGLVLVTVRHQSIDGVKIPMVTKFAKPLVVEATS